MLYDCSSIAFRITPVGRCFKCCTNVVRMAAKYGSNIEKFIQNAAGILQMHFKYTWSVTRMSKMYQEYDHDQTASRLAIKCCRIAHFHQSQLSTQPSWSTWTMLFVADCCPLARTALKEIWKKKQEKRKRTKTPKYVRPVHGW